MPEVVGLAASFGAPGPEWDQGDVVDGVYFAALDKVMPAILMTPSCDVEQDKVDLWTLVVLYPDFEVARALVAKDLSNWKSPPTALSKGQRTSLANVVRGLLGQRLPRYHWIPIPVGGSPAQVADFSCVGSLPAKEVKAKARRIATLRSSWREHLPARYSAFMSRVGTLDFKEEEISVEIERLVASIAPQ